MINTNAFLGIPINYKNICSIYPPKIKEVVSNPQFLQLFKMLTYSQEDIEDLLSELKKDNSQDNKKVPTPIEFVLINSYQNDSFKSLIEQGFELFIHEPVTFIYAQKMILIGKIEDLSTVTDFSQFRYLSEDNFFDFQNCLRAAMGEEPVSPPDLDENPVVKRVKAASRRRKRLANKNKNKKGISLTTSLGAICCMGIGLTPLNIGEMSYACIDVIMNLYQQKEKYQTDIDSLMAGANPKKIHPKYWIRDNSDFNEIQI